ncbi:PEPxxWA-CTERM sorting domain-containing protein [Sphingomonas sp. dw_22]|uniref:PEPxxWA-CTERM sorting domain-containing protein n=1 Tax=Sphingomonas sp. dw_22 TaxID=2721175 RepID=UPI001BD653F8|nr:PEPxxWA-CTERM sorting domain-containing protein [Sphingomonas sp. dw_22]
MKNYLVAAALVGALAAGGAQAQTIYSNDFDGNVVTGSGVTVTSANASGTGTALSGSWNAAGWDGTFLQNASISPITVTEFSFSGLGAHSGISLGGVLGFLQSWDSSNGGPYTPDFLEILIDGTLAARFTANNASGTNTAAAGGNIIAFHDQTDSNLAYSDTLIDFTGSPWATFAHTGSSLTIAFRAAGSGWQGGTDESWGLDSFKVTAVPEPASWAMMIGGFGLAGAAIRRRRSKLALA